MNFYRDFCNYYLVTYSEFVGFLEFITAHRLNTAYLRLKSLTNNKNFPTIFVFPRLYTYLLDHFVSTTSNNNDDKNIYIYIYITFFLAIS